jgi:hypothetical protein
LSTPKPQRPGLKPFIPPKDNSTIDEELELTLYNAMYSNRKNMRLTKKLSDDINAEIKKLIKDNLND